MARRLIIQERMFIVETIAELKSRNKTWRRFKRKFGHEVNVKTIDATVKKWKEVDTDQDQFKYNKGRRKSARTPENQTKINSLVASNNKTSVRRLIFAVSLKKSSVHNILRNDLHLTPYKPKSSKRVMISKDLPLVRKLKR